MLICAYKESGGHPYGKRELLLSLSAFLKCTYIMAYMTLKIIF